MDVKKTKYPGYVQWKCNFPAFLKPNQRSWGLPMKNWTERFIMDHTEVLSRINRLKSKLSVQRDSEVIFFVFFTTDMKTRKWNKTFEFQPKIPGPDNFLSSCEIELCAGKDTFGALSGDELRGVVDPFGFHSQKHFFLLDFWPFPGWRHGES